MQIKIKEIEQELLQQQQKNAIEMEKLQQELSSSISDQVKLQLQVDELTKDKNLCNTMKTIALNSYQICSDALAGELIVKPN
ncbi:unnamed protein product [Diamesa serratosioi]